MKKIVFLLAIVFTMSSFTTEKEHNNSNIFFQDCWNDAWDFGTGWGSDYDDWYYTDWYANAFCDDNGNYLEGSEPEGL